MFDVRCTPEISGARKSYIKHRTMNPSFFAGLAGLVLPNEPLKIFPFFVLISPRPIITVLFL